MIPEIKDFNDFLSGLSVSDNANQNDSKYSLSVNLSGNLPPIYIHQTFDSKITWDGFVSKVINVLNKEGFLVNEYLVRLVIAIFSRRNRGTNDLADKFNEMISKSVNLNIIHYFVMPVACPDDLEDFSFGEYKIGRFEKEKFDYRIAKAGSALFPGIKLKDDFFSVTHPAVEVKSMITSLDIKTQSEYHLVQSYFDELAGLSFLKFWEKIESLQSLALPVGGVDFPGSMLKSTPSCMSISLFTGLDNSARGFLCLEGNFQMYVSLSQMDKHSLRAIKNLNDLGLSLDQHDKVHPALKIVLNLFRTSLRHYGSGHIEDSFLNFIITLEVLFGDRARIEDTMSKRAAIVSHKMLNMDLKKAVVFFKEIYSERSRFVHSGICKINIENLRQLKAVVGGAISCALVASKDKEDFDMDKWRSDIDFIFLSASMGKEITPADYMECGLNYDLLNEIQINHGKL